MPVFSDSKQLSELKAQLAVYQAEQYLSRAETLPSGAKLLVLELSDLDNKVMLELVEQLKNKLGTSIIVIGCINAQRVNLVVGVSKDISAKYKAGAIVNHLAGLVGGKGGGRPDLAQAGGTNVAELGAALATARVFIENMA